MDPIRKAACKVVYCIAGLPVKSNKLDTESGREGKLAGQGCMVYPSDPSSRFYDIAGAVGEEKRELDRGAFADGGIAGDENAPGTYVCTRSEID